MSEQLDRIESAIASLTGAVVQLQQGQTELRAEVSNLRQGQTELRAEVSNLRQGQTELRADLAQVDAKVDALQEQLRGEAENLVSIAVSTSDQVRRAEQNIESFKGEIRQFLVQMQEFKGSIEAHIAHTERLLNYLLRRIGPDSVA